MAVPLANPLTELEYPCRLIKAGSRQRWQWICFWHLASFDAPTVAVVWALAFAWLAKVHLDAWVPLLLACGTWSVYVGDRVFDAYRAIRTGRLDTLRERHFFHWRHRGKLIPLASCSAVAAAMLIVHRMPVVIRERNSVLAAAALMYFSGVHSTATLPAWLRRIASKELLVGVLFTAGCAAPTLSQMRISSAYMASLWPLLACCAYFAALAWSNCCAIESWESPGSTSRIGLRTGLLTVAGIAMAVVLAFAHPHAAALTLTATAGSALLLLLHRKRAQINPVMLRTLADAVLLTPALLLIAGAFPGVYRG